MSQPDDPTHLQHGFLIKTLDRFYFKFTGFYRFRPRFLCLLVLLPGLMYGQQTDSTHIVSSYASAWSQAMKDGRVSPDERALLDAISQGLMLPDSIIDLIERPDIDQTVPHLDQSGRWPLVAQNMFLGVGLYGWAIPFVLGAEDDFRWTMGSEMLSLGTAFYLTYKYTADKSMTHAQTQMMRYGSLLAIRYGTAVNELFGLYGEEDQEPEPKAWAWVLMASVPAGHYLGNYAFEKLQPSNGQAWAWTLWTGISGLTARNAYEVFDPDPYPDESFDVTLDWERLDAEQASWQKRLTTAEILAYPLGGYLGYRLIQNKSYSFGDAIMLYQGWGYGFYNAMMLQSLLDDDESDFYWFNASIGAIVSTLAYDRWISGQDFSFGQSILMLLGSASGTAFGYGTAVILDVNNNRTFLTLGLGGYALGTVLTRKILDPEPDGALTDFTPHPLIIQPAFIPAQAQDGKSRLLPGLQIKYRF